MRRARFGVIAAVVIGAAAIAGPPTAVGIWFDHSVKYKLTCSSSGSSAQVIPNGKYAVRVMDEQSNLVWGTATYDGGAANNSPWPKDTAWLESVFESDGGIGLACQSTGGTGHVYLDGTH